MEPSFSVSIDPARGLLRLKLVGFFDSAAVARLKAERDRAVERLNCGRNRHVTICDISEQNLSSPEIAEEFKRVIGDPRYASRRLAFVLQGALEKMMTRRLAERPDVGYFLTVAEAEAWLFADGPDAPERIALAERV